MLHDLRLQELPDDVLYVLRDAIEGEITRRASRLRPYQWPQGLTTDEALDERWLPRDPGPPYALPRIVRYRGVQERLRYLPSVLAQDWTSCFAGSYDVQAIYYVYAHIDPRERHTALLHGRRLPGQPFYIGKGSGQRAWDLKRNAGHGKRIQILSNLGYDQASLVHVLAEGLTEQQALCLEAKLIYFFGSIYDETVQGCLLNLADTIRPQFAEELPRPQVKDTCNISWAKNRKWAQWQNSTTAKKYLSVEARDAGWTVLNVGPRVRDLFLELVPLLHDYQRLSPRRLTDPPIAQGWKQLGEVIKSMKAYMFPSS